MKNAIIQYDVDSNKYDDPRFNNLTRSDIVKYSTHSIGEYCKKYNIDHVVITEPKLENIKHPVFERFDLILNDAWWNKYEQILHVDSDVIVHESVPNFFEEHSNPVSMKTAIYPKYNASSDKWWRANITHSLYKNLDPKQCVERFFQTGVFGLTKHSARCLRPYVKNFRMLDSWDDGQIINWAFISSGVKHEKVSQKWNFKLRDKLVPNNKTAYFIHPAGGRKHRKDSHIQKYCRLRWPNL